MIPKIKFEYRGKKYILRFTRETVLAMERDGFDACELLGKPLTLALTKLPELFAASFRANHPATPEKLIREIYSKFDNKLDLLNALVSMYADAVGQILDRVEAVHNSGISWEKC